MELNLQKVDRVKSITKSAFIKQYVRPQKPLVIENLVDDWPAVQKWDFDYFREKVGDKTVPLYDDRPVDYNDGFNQAHATMKMSAYIDLLQKEPTLNLHSPHPNQESNPGELKLIHRLSSAKMLAQLQQQMLIH